MKTTKEQFKTYTYRAPRTKQKVKLEVGDRGTIKYCGSKLKPFVFDKRHGYKYVRVNKPDFGGLLPVHRLVALAWVEGKTALKKQVDHKNSKRGDNRAQNLQWVSRKQNNTSSHAQRLRSKHAKCASHKDEVIKATKDGSTMFFIGGRMAAEYIGCSRVLVYNVLNPAHWAKKAKGWSLEWVPVSSIDLSEKESK